MFILIALIICYRFPKNDQAIASDIKAYEEMIEKNNHTINQYEEIKAQLHTTANLIRNTENFNTEFVNSLSQKWHDYNNAQVELRQQNSDAETTITEIQKENEPIFLGYYTITYYCVENYPHICNDGNSSRTSTGTTPTPGRTVAVDPKTISYGSKLSIGDCQNTYIAEDCGGGIKENRIDICVATHAEALQKGKLTNVPVYLLK